MKFKRKKKKRFQQKMYWLLLNFMIYSTNGKLIIHMKHGALRKRLVWCMSEESCQLGSRKESLRIVLKTGSRYHVPIQEHWPLLGFFISVSSGLLETLVISLSHYQWIQGKLARPHFDIITVHFIVI